MTMIAAFLFLLLSCAGIIPSTNGFIPQIKCSKAHCRISNQFRPLKMKATKGLEESSRRISQSKVSAVSIATMNELSAELQSSSFLEDFLVPVVCTACLITGNTVGASMLVLPELAAGPGMTITTCLFLTMYIINLISGLAIADIAIQQKEESGTEAPSSFKAFAESTLDNPLAPYIISLICISMNTLVLTFDNLRASQLGQEIFHIDPQVGSLVWAAMVAAIVGTQSAPNLSKASSVLVLVLFCTFGAILLPGLANVADPLSLFTSSLPWGSEGGSLLSADIFEQVGYAGPVILTSLVWQNITPTVVRVLGYDRTKTTSAILLGTILPVLMYIAWCISVLGGGVDMSSIGLDGPLLTIFSFVTVSGSCLGTATSMAEEFDTYLIPDKKSTIQKGAETVVLEKQQATQDSKESLFSPQAVAATMAVSLALGQFFSDDVTSLLKLAGSFGSPLLYGAIPVWMAYTQQNQRQQQTAESASQNSLVPGGYATLACLGLVSFGYVGTGIWQGMGQVVAPLTSTIAI